MFADLETKPENLPTRKGADDARHKCEKCGGSGQVRFGYVNVHVGKCFKCNGTGYFKTSAATRQQQRLQRAKREDNKRENNVAVFAEQYPLQHAWLARKANSSEFARSLLDGVVKYGQLTPKQLAAVDNILAKDADREKAPAPVGNLNLGDVRKRFALAKQAGIQRPKINLGDLVFSMAGDGSKNPGMIYVKGGTAYEAPYYGKVDQNGDFFPARSLDGEVQQRIVSVGQDVLSAARAHGAQHGKCCFCNRALNTNESVSMGYGPICAEKYNLPWEVSEEFLEAKAQLKEANDAAAASVK